MKRFWIINLVLFQASWACAALFNSHAYWVMPILFIVHVALSPTRKQDLKLLALVPIGLMADKVQLDLGIFSAGDGFFPFWLLMMWVMFVMSLNHSLSWLDNRSAITLMIIGAIGGTSSYWGGIKAGVIQPLLSSDDVAIFLLLVWSLLLPTMVYLKRYLTHTTATRIRGQA